MFDSDNQQIVVDLVSGEEILASDFILNFKSGLNQPDFSHEDLKMFFSTVSRDIRDVHSLKSDAACSFLAWWCRKANITRLYEEWSFLSNKTKALRAPLGTLFHIPPANVPTMLVFPWLISAIVGNSNVIRVPERTVSEFPELIEILIKNLITFEKFGKFNRLVSYRRNFAITEELSKLGSRVVWGGDDSINTISKIPIPSHFKQINFPSRESLSLIRAEALQSISGLEIGILAERFANDILQFDQMACSSPSKLVWVANEWNTEAANCCRDFLNQVTAFIENKSYPKNTSSYIQRISKLFEKAADGEVVEANWSERSLVTFKTQSKSAQLRKDVIGGGFLEERFVTKITDLVNYLSPSTQTLTTYGTSECDKQEIKKMIQSGADILRVVPIGEALDFSHIWDGKNLFEEFSKVASISFDF